MIRTFSTAFMLFHIITFMASPNLYAAQGTIPSLTQEDQQFLQQSIQFPLGFPRDAEDPLVNQAADFLNQLMDENPPQTYQALMDAITQQDQEMSKSATPIIPGAFVDACAALYSTSDILASDFPDLSPQDQTQTVIKGKQEVLQFANILAREAKIISSPTGSLQQAVDKLKDQLRAAQQKGQTIRTVYVYGQTPQDEVVYQTIYHDYPEIKFIYRLFPQDFATFVTDTNAITDGIIFFDTVPTYYPALYQPDWFPFYDRFSVAGPLALGVGSFAALKFYNHYYHKKFSHDDWRDWSHRRLGHKAKTHHSHIHHASRKYVGHAKPVLKKSQGHAHAPLKQGLLKQAPHKHTAHSHGAKSHAKHAAHPHKGHKHTAHHAKTHQGRKKKK